MRMSLRLRTPPPCPIDVASLSLARLRTLPADQVQKLPLRIGRRTAEVGEWFAVSGRAESGIVFEGDCGRLCGIGTGLSEGEVMVDGPAGNRLGRQISGGTIRVTGHVGAFAASGMRGGRIDVEGHAGDSLGGPLRGERTGMRGGRVVIRGNAGARVGHRLRRGTIIVNGRVGPNCGWEMVAGTIAVGRADDDGLAFAMRRGTILVGDADAEPFAVHTPCFSPATEAPPVFVRLLINDLAPDWSQLSERRTARWKRSIGDLSQGGLGEVIW